MIYFLTMLSLVLFFLLIFVVMMVVHLVAPQVIRCWETFQVEERSVVPVEEALRTDPDRALLTSVTVLT